MTKAFHLFDHDNVGKISIKNLERVAKEVGEELRHEDLLLMLHEADKNGDGVIDLEEFLAVMKRSALF